MTEGLEGLTEQLSVGFLDLADDLPQRLPSFLAAYDAVVLGESSFHYARYVTGGRVRVGGGGGGGGKAGTTAHRMLTQLPSPHRIPPLLWHRPPARYCAHACMHVHARHVQGADRGRIGHEPQGRPRPRVRPGPPPPPLRPVLAAADGRLHRGGHPHPFSSQGMGYTRRHRVRRARMGRLDVIVWEGAAGLVCTLIANRRPCQTTRVIIRPGIHKQTRPSYKHPHHHMHHHRRRATTDTHFKKSSTGRAEERASRPTRRLERVYFFLSTGKSFLSWSLTSPNAT
jgi:hypothetical protein